MIAMEAMDQLLVACHAQTLNLFVESYLRIVQKLLESSEPSLQILATQSVFIITNNFYINKMRNNGIVFVFVVCTIFQHRRGHTIVS